MGWNELNYESDVDEGIAGNSSREISVVFNETNLVYFSELSRKSQYKLTFLKLNNFIFTIICSTFNRQIYN